MWNEEQRAVIESKADTKQVIAGAGSGKTATMIGLLQQAESEKGIPPDRTLIVTFTNKATDEFIERIQRFKLSENYNVSTFHAFCYRMLKNHHPEFSSQNMLLLNEKDKADFSFDFLYQYRFEIGGIPFPILFKREGLLFRNEFPQIYSIYSKALQDWKRKNRYFEFEDLPDLLHTGLHAQASWTEKIKENFSSIIVDEFQDTDNTQLAILKFLAPEKLTIVGDDWQAIYGFRGATPEPFLNFPTTFPMTKQFTLTTNYRSLKGIIHLSEHALKKNKQKISKSIKHSRDGQTCFHKIIMESPKNDRHKILPELRQFFDSDVETIMLVRSNFRKKEWIQVGVPESKLLTIHAAKGLEFGTVILDLSAGWNLPEGEDMTQIEEERRILYVGISRAKNRLILIGRQRNKKKLGLEDEFFEYYRFFDLNAKPTLRSRLVW